MKKTFTWHREEPEANGRIGPTYYNDADCTPLAVRLHAVNTPRVDASFDILVDGVSILSEGASLLVNKTTGVISRGTSTRKVILSAGENTEEAADDWDEGGTIPAGSWVHCVILDSGGGSNFTVQLEVETLD